MESIERTSRIYQASSGKTYFEQCFKVIRILGKGVFGETIVIHAKFRALTIRFPQEISEQLAPLRAVEVLSLEDGEHYAIKRALRTFESSGNRRMKLREVLVHESVPNHANILRLKKAWEERGISCKLGDFGLAYNLTKISTGCFEEGDKYYMAPEILNDNPTTAADIFSLGVTMLELATDVDLDKDRELIRSEKIPSGWFGDLAIDLVQVIKSMLMVDHLQRPSAKNLLDIMKRNQRPSTRFRTMEISPAASTTGMEDDDWDFKISEDEEVLKVTQITSLRSRLDFDEEDGDCSAPKKPKRGKTQQLSSFSRRLDFVMDTNESGSKPLKKRRLNFRIGRCIVFFSGIDM
ncbi:hypothetical protein DICVIV_09242 [Dictyocaulus viviparus]|uniref:non-specific serine/threonine protein kinase n=1 Tax=Dictyocaulus viviparus TaxID=29172 RepID=A0A0D8XJI7_DICVI|nr:hypothetical protein DICVIV_09242 [Dictyocaulus viviparus]